MLEDSAELAGVGMNFNLVENEKREALGGLETLD